jgi:RNA polymerase sigma factor (sigma-70 family)
VPDADYLEQADPLISRLIRAKARRLTGQARLRVEDVEDLAQDCRAELVRKFAAFDPARGSLPAFVVRVLANLVTNRLRDRLAAKRDPRRVRPAGRLPEPLPAAYRHARRLRTDLERAELRLDLEVVVRTLKPELRALAERLRRQSLAEAARQTGVPRTTLQSRVRALRAVFERHDLRDFL